MKEDFIISNRFFITHHLLHKNCPVDFYWRLPTEKDYKNNFNSMTFRTEGFG